MRTDSYYGAPGPELTIYKKDPVGVTASPMGFWTAIFVNVLLSSRRC
jgi:hypothetical protein